MKAAKTPPTIPITKFHQYPCRNHERIYLPTIAIELNPLLSEVVIDVAKALAVLVFLAARAATASWPVRVTPSETIVVSDGMKETVSSADVEIVALEEAAAKDLFVNSDGTAEAALHASAKFVAYNIATYSQMAL